MVVKHAIANTNPAHAALRLFFCMRCRSLDALGRLPLLCTARGLHHAVVLVPGQGMASLDQWSHTSLLWETLAGGKCSRESGNSCINTAKKISPYSAGQRGAPSGSHRGSWAVAKPWSIPGRLMGVALERKAGIMQVTDSKSSNSRTVLQLLVHDLASLGLWVLPAVV